jgi:hypothetical protein
MWHEGGAVMDTGRRTPNAPESYRMGAARGCGYERRRPETGPIARFREALPRGNFFRPLRRATTPAAAG